MKKNVLAGIVLSLFASAGAEAGFGKHTKTFTPTPVYKMAKKKVWVEGHYQVQLQRIWVPGHFQNVWVQPVYAEYAYFGKCSVKVLVKAGHYKKVWVAGHYKAERCKVWAPGHWVEC